MPRLLLIRHGETGLNSSERYWGSTDVDLSAAGLWQAGKLRDRLAKENIHSIYSSDLKRAIVTAKTIATLHKREVTACAELREIDFGRLEGLTFSQVNERYPDIVQLWLEQSPELAFPGGESISQFEERITSFSRRLQKLSGEETILVVAHSGALRTLICQLLGTEPRQRWQIRLDLASLTIVETYPQGAILTLLNDVSHLAGGG